MTFLVKNGGYAFVINIRFNLFYVIMRRVSIVTNFKQPIYQTFN